MKALQEMTKREMVLIAGAFISVVYGIYIFFPTKPPGRKISVNSNTYDLNQFATEAARKIKKGAMTAQETELLARIRKAWATDPFVGERYFVQSRIDEGPPKPESVTLDLDYSGILIMGDRKLAVIEGIEYGKGESLVSHPGYTLQEVTSQFVLLRAIKDGRTYRVAFKEAP